MANLNRPGTLEFAIRDAMDQLGAHRVAKILECSASVLYKATSPNNPTRGLPQITWRQVEEIVAALRTARRRKRQRGTPTRTEHFSDVLRLIGRAAPPPRSADINHNMSAATADVGVFARTICEVTDAHGPNGSGVTPDEYVRLSQTGRRAIGSIAAVLRVAEQHSRTPLPPIEQLLEEDG